MSLKITVIVCCLIGSAAGAPFVEAQEPDRSEYELVLLPVNVKQTPGAHGSIWTSIFSAFNAGVAHARYFPEGVTCPFTCPGPTPGEVPSGWRVEPDTNFGSSQSGQPGALFYLEKATAKQVGLSLRIQDLSRQNETFGTEIPVIREEELHEGTLMLSTAPPLDGFRQLLRIYEVDVISGATVLVRFLNYRGEQLAELTLATRWHLPEDPTTGFPATPGYAELSNLENFMSMAETDGKPASIVIEPLTEGVRYWAFVSVTHNETQHVTLLTPQ
jgi:hypothetical protein